MALSMLAVFAHPDDESFAVGGTLAKYSAEGVKITLVTATRGELSTLGDMGLPPAKLAATREQELSRAARVIGIERVHILGYKDGGLAAVLPGELSDCIQAIMSKVMPDVVLTFDSTGVTCHPDHIAVSRAATNAFDETLAAAHGKAAHPSKLYYWVVPERVAIALNSLFNTSFSGAPSSKIAVAVDVSDYLPIQRQAILAHHSQCAPIPPVLEARLGQQEGREYFTLAASTIEESAETGEDLFAGLRDPVALDVSPPAV